MGATATAFASMAFAPPAPARRMSARSTPARPAPVPLALAPLALAGFLLFPAWGAAQITPSVLELLPTGDRVVQAGASAEGVLGEAEDFRLPDSSPVQAWEVRGEPGSWVWIDLVSDSFDAFLYVFDPGRGELLVDDDSGGGCHARIPVVIPPQGHVVAVASQVGIPFPGPFTLSVSTEEPPVLQEVCAYATEFGLDQDPWDLPADLEPVGALAPVPGEVRGTLAPGEGPAGPAEGSMEAWTVALEEGQIIQFDLESDVFDAVLILAGPGIEGYILDDDGGEGLNSRLVFTVLRPGTYTLYVTAWGEEAAGEYRLRATEILAPSGPGR